MDAKIVTLANQKGGTGKTTTAMTLAAGLSRRGYSVLVVDGDPQGTSTRWAASAPDGRPFPALVINLAAAQRNLHKMVRDHVTAHDVIVIDCPPNVESPNTQSAMLIADLILVPVIPRPGELWALERIFQLLREVPDVEVRLVPVQLQNNNVVAETIAVLAQSPVKLARSCLSHRVGFIKAMAFGGTCFEAGDPVAVEEANALTTEVLQLLGLKTKRTALKSA